MKKIFFVGTSPYKFRSSTPPGGERKKFVASPNNRGMYHDVRAPRYSGDLENFMDLITIDHCFRWPFIECVRVFGVSSRALGPLIVYDTARKLQRIMMDHAPWICTCLLVCSLLSFLS